jgi:hypothetical protein
MSIYLSKFNPEDFESVPEILSGKCDGCVFDAKPKRCSESEEIIDMLVEISRNGNGCCAEEPIIFRLKQNNYN